MTSSEIIKTYEDILSVTGQMLEAARNNDWDALVERETECRKLVEQLMTAKAEAETETNAELEPEARKRKVEIIRKVLADDAEIRNLTEPWLARLQHLMTSAGHERRLHAAYGSGSAG